MPSTPFSPPSPQLLSELAEVLYSEPLKSAVLPVCDHYAGNPKFLDKALAMQQKLGPCFDITLDLEDGAVVGQEQEASRWAADAVRVYAQDNPTARRNLGVRVHPIGHPAFETDINALLQADRPMPAYLMLPKPGGVAEVSAALQRVREVCSNQGLSTPPLHVLIESHEALAQVHAIASVEGVESLSFGIMDFVSSHRGAIPKSALNSPAQFENALVMRAKVEIAAACHRHGKVPSHSVCRDIRNPQAAGDDARMALNLLGYTRMWSIHPSQIEPIVEALRPSQATLDEAYTVLSLAQQAQWGPIEHEGQLHDRASYRYFYELLKAHANQQ